MSVMRPGHRLGRRLAMVWLGCRLGFGGRLGLWRRLAVVVMVCRFGGRVVVVMMVVVVIIPVPGNQGIEH